MADDVIRAGSPEMDDCPILTRFNAFLVDQGVTETLEHVFRDRKGNPVDLSKHLTTQASQSSASINTMPHDGSLVLRVREWLGHGLSPANNPIWEIQGEGWEPEKGIVRATLEQAIVDRPGIYELHWAVLVGKQPIKIDRALMSVEHSLFPSNLTEALHHTGPPTLREIRMRLMDSSAAENQYNLEDIEFKDEQILMAIWEPVRLWNETPPPIETFTTRTFPFRGAWIQGIMAQLHFMMANHFRRNFLQHSAGGGAALNDKNKEREYMGEAQRLWEDYKNWLTPKKIEINLRKFHGDNWSAYSSRNGW